LFWRLCAWSDGCAGFVVSVGKTERFMELDILFGMGSSSLLDAVFFISVFLLGGAVWNLTKGDFYFLSLSVSFIYLIYYKASFLFEFRCIHFISVLWDACQEEIL
jgi:hypothetical protein